MEHGQEVSLQLFVACGQPTHVLQAFGGKAAWRERCGRVRVATGVAGVMNPNTRGLAILNADVFGSHGLTEPEPLKESQAVVRILEDCHIRLIEDVVRIDQKDAFVCCFGGAIFAEQSVAGCKEEIGW